MGRVYKAKDLQRALVRKGFQLHEGHHHMYFLFVDGKRTSVFTKVSHGLSEYSGGLVSAVRKQMGRLNNKEFDDFVDCPMSHADYIEKLRERGVLTR